MFGQCFRRKRTKKLVSKVYPYVLVDSLLTPCERRFYDVLRSVVPAGVAINAKTRLADVLRCPENKWKDFGWRVSNRHLDFLLVDTRTLQPILGIELDDSTHQKRDRRTRDRFLDGAAAQAGLQILHVTAMARYDAKALRRVLDKVLC